MKLHPGLLIIFVLFLSNCSIQEEIHFKKDFSGNLTYSINLSQVKMFAGMLSNELDSTNKGSDELDFSSGLSDGMMKSSFGEVGDIEGISNFKSNLDESGIINFSFDFANIDALNRAYNQLNSDKNMGDLPGGGFTPGPAPSEEQEKPVEKEPKEDFEFFKVKGKTLTYRRPQVDLDQEEMKDMPISMDAFQGLGDIFSLETKFTFDRKVKKVDASQITIAEQESKMVDLKLGMKNLTSTQNAPAEVVIKLK